MAVNRKRTGNRRGAKKKTSSGIPAWFWLLGGILIGLGIAVGMMLKGYLPELKQHLPSVDSSASGSTESALVEEKAAEVEKPKKPRYDFFTVLPEMEVVVPEQELRRQAKPVPDEPPGRVQDKYILQAGSFKSSADAEQLKARLALLGSMATIQTVTVNGEIFEIQNRDSLYIGRGNEEVLFSSNSTDEPSRYALFSYPAHTAFPSKLVRQDEARRLDLGDDGRANDRVITQSICPGIVDTCQLVMGFTQLKHGSVWNTMPPHTHRRRSEIYMYFDIPDGERVFHFMGEPNRFRTILTKSGEAVVSPSWSVHFGVGTGPYTFIWSMGGENQVFDDMDSFSFE